VNFITFCALIKLVQVIETELEV